MPLPDYDPDRHHIGLGVSSSALKGFSLAGGARAMLQNAPQVTEFGSSRNLVDAPSLSRWTQDDFLGGAFWPSWHSNDPTVWSSSRNYVPSQQGRSLRSAPPFVLWDDETGGTTPGAYVGAMALGDYVVTLWANKLVRTSVVDKSRVEFAVPVGETYHAMGIDSVGPVGYPVLMLSRLQVPDRVALFKRYRLDTWAADTDWNFTVTPLYGKGHVIGFEMDGIVPVLVIAGTPTDSSSRNELYSFTGPTAVTLVGRLPGTWIDSCVYNGLTYVLCTEPLTGLTRIVTTDGGAISVLMDLPYNFVGQAMTSYAGSIWVLGTGSDVNNVARYGELHQLTGNTSRLVKTFSPESQVDVASHTTVLTKGLSLTVWEGLLWIGGVYDRLIAYDVTTDALYGASEYDNGSGVTEVRYLSAVKGDLFGFGVNSVEPSRTGWYRVARVGDGVTSFSPEFVSSDFNPEPALDKRWAEVHVLSRYDAADPTVEFSTDGGGAWTSATVSVVTSGTFKRSVGNLSVAPVSRQLRVRLRFPRGSNVSHYQELLAFTVTFSFLDSGKRSWVMPVLGVSRPELEDGDYPEQDIGELESQLWSWIRSQDRLVFASLDGGLFDVQLVNLQKLYTEIGPSIEGSSREGFYHLSLVEV